jgi:hypothetical protein
MTTSQNKTKLFSQRLQKVKVKKKKEARTIRVIKEITLHPYR